MRSAFESFLDDRDRGSQAAHGELRVYKVPVFKLRQPGQLLPQIFFKDKKRNNLLTNATEHWYSGYRKTARVRV
jgi:hypothetical protein